MALRIDEIARRPACCLYDECPVCAGCRADNRRLQRCANCPWQRCRHTETELVALHKREMIRVIPLREVSA